MRIFKSFESHDPLVAVPDVVNKMILLQHPLMKGQLNVLAAKALVKSLRFSIKYIENMEASDE